MSAHIDSIKIPLLSAFPNGNKTPENMGLSMRDYFAAKAMQGEIASQLEPDYSSEIKIKMLAEWAYWLADAMMEARKK